MKNVPGKNVCTVVRHLKGAMLLLQKYAKLPTELIRLLNDIICLANNDDFVSFMKNIYFNHCQKTNAVNCLSYLDFAESKYRTLYCAHKWTAFRSDPASGFFLGNSNDNDKHVVPGEDEHSGQRSGYNHLNYHSHGLRSHVTHNYYLIGGGAYNDPGQMETMYPHYLELKIKHFDVLIVSMNHEFVPCQMVAL